jgi:hypothetical protein
MAARYATLLDILRRNAAATGCVHEPLHSAPAQLVWDGSGDDRLKAVFPKAIYGLCFKEPVALVELRGALATFYDEDGQVRGARRLDLPGPDRFLDLRKIGLPAGVAGVLN